VIARLHRYSSKLDQSVHLRVRGTFSSTRSGTAASIGTKCRTLHYGVEDPPGASDETLSAHRV
jgi:hypothetical protein